MERFGLASVKTTRELGHLRHYPWMDPRRQQRWLTWPKGGDGMKWLEGKKTYIIAIVCVVYGVLAYAKVKDVPGPQALGAMLVAVGALATGFRSALANLASLIQSLGDRGTF